MYTKQLVQGAKEVSQSRSASGADFDSFGSSARKPNVIPPDVADPSSPRVRMVEEFMQGTAESEDWMRKWYTDNYEKVKNYDFLHFELLYFLNEKMPGIKVDEKMEPLNLVELVKELVLDLQTKVNKFNVELREISGHEIAGAIKYHHKKVLQVVEDYENQLKSANEELSQYKAQMVHLDTELTAVLQRLQYYEGEADNYDGYLEDSVTEESFMADLQSRVAHSQALSSSMREQLDREKAQNEGLKSQLAHLAREKVQTEEKCMQEIVELSKRAEINSMLEHGLESIIAGGSKEPNSEDCQKVIDQWKTEINQAIDQNSKEIDELIKKVENQNNELATLQAQSSELDDNLEKMQRKAQNKQKLFDKYKEQAARLQAQVNDFKKVIEELSHESSGLQSFWDRGGAQPPEEEEMEEYSIDDGLAGDLDYDVTQDTQPIRWGRRRRRRQREPIYSSSESSSPGEGSPTMGFSAGEEQPMGRMGVMRFEDRPASRSPQEEIAASRGPMRFVDGQWVGMEGTAPQAAPMPQPPSGSDLMRPMRLDDIGGGTVGGRQSPIEQAQAGGAMRFVGGQWVPAAPQPPSGSGLMRPMRLDDIGGGTVGGRQSPIEQAQAGGAMRFVGGQWVPAAPQLPPLHSTFRDRTLGQSRIPTRGGATSPGFDVSSILPGSPRVRSPPRLEVPSMRPMTPMSGTPTRLQISDMESSMAMSGTPTRLQVSDMESSMARSGTPSRLQVPGMASSMSRAATPPRLQVPGMAPSMSRAATPPRLQVPGMPPAMSRAVTPPRLPVPNLRLTTTRAGTYQRLGASRMGPATTATRARATPAAGPSGMRPAATRPGTPPRPRVLTQRQPAMRAPTAPRSAAAPRTQPAAPRARVQPRSAVPRFQPAAQRPQRQGASSMQPPPQTPADPLMSRVMLFSPMRQEPLALDVDVAPQRITSTGEDFACEVAVGVRPAPPETGGQNAGRNPRARRPRPHFTPRTGFQR